MEKVQGTEWWGKQRNASWKLKGNWEVGRQTWLEEMEGGEKKKFLCLNGYVRAAAGAL